MTAGRPNTRRPSRPVTPTALENAALHYLQRFACSAEALRRVLLRRVERSVREHESDREEAAGWVDALVARYRASGLLDDAAYARLRTDGLHRRGASSRAIRRTLAAKGVDADLVEAALGGLAEDAEGDPELAAATALARRRRLGPFRRDRASRPAHRDRDLAALGRAGFGYDLARRVVDAPTPEAIGEE